MCASDKGYTECYWKSVLQPSYPFFLNFQYTLTYTQLHCCSLQQSITRNGILFSDFLTDHMWIYGIYGSTIHSEYSEGSVI